MERTIIKMLLMIIVFFMGILLSLKLRGPCTPTIVSINPRAEFQPREVSQAYLHCVEPVQGHQLNLRQHCEELDVYHFSIENCPMHRIPFLCRLCKLVPHSFHCIGRALSC